MNKIIKIRVSGNNGYRLLNTSCVEEVHNVGIDKNVLTVYSSGNKVRVACTLEKFEEFLLERQLTFLVVEEVR